MKSRAFALVLTLAIHTTAAASHIRYDRKPLHPLDSSSLVFEQHHTHSPPRRFHAASLSTASTDSPVLLEFICDFNSVLCLKAEQATLRSFRFVADLLILKRPIVVQASYLPFCDGNPEPCTRDNLGFASSSANWFLTNSSTVWLPQALAKQLSPHERDWNPHDIHASFNADTLTDGSSRFWFEGDAPIRRDQYCYEYLVLHELLHGLGILTYFSDSLSGDTITPAMVQEMRSSRGVDKVYARGALPHIIFDTLVYSTSDDRSLTDFHSSFADTFGSRAQLSENWSEAFKNSPAYIAAQELYVLSTTSQLEVRLPDLTEAQRMAFTGAGIAFMDNARIQVESAYSPFKTSSSICHFSQHRYTGTEDFLMRPEATRGVTLRSLTPRDKFPIGPLTTRLLCAMGFEISDQPLERYGNAGVRVVSSVIMVYASIMWWSFAYICI